MKVFYDGRQAADSCSYSPSAAKPPLVVEAWRRAVRVEIMPVRPLTVDEMALAHQRRYVQQVLRGKRPNGFGNTSKEVAASLPYTNGSMYAAARHATLTGESCASPTSGFHHAGWDNGGGFCTFNGLMVAACMLKVEGLVSKVAIIDFDQHYGNGTDNIIAKLRIDWINHLTFGQLAIRSRRAEAWARERVVSREVEAVRQVPAGLGWIEDEDGDVLPPEEGDWCDADFELEEDDEPNDVHQLAIRGAWEERGQSVDQWLAALPTTIAELVADCDLAIYQAGADPHIDDPLGGVLTTEDMGKRDAIVFNTCRTMGVPVAWNLAGGYQTPIDRVVELHVQTAREFAAADLE